MVGILDENIVSCKGKEKIPEKYEAVSFDEFESIGIVNAKDKAARFYAVMFFHYSIYDGASAQK